jgi:hypothetical protein
MAPIAISRDSLDYERRGRIIGEDQHKGAIRARVRELMAMGGGRAGSHTAVTPSPAQRLGLGKGASRETMLKIVSWTKDRASPLAQARYASRTRTNDPPSGALHMISDDGRELRGAEIEAEVKSWGLKTDAENLSPAAKLATPKERREMSAKDRLKSRQAVHIIFSVPAHAKADSERLGRAVDLSLRETFGEGGYRYLYTIHTDHSTRPHAHIIAKAQSEPIETKRGRRTIKLRLQPRELEAMRQVFTRHAQQQGIDVIATRREDRHHLRADILTGRAPLRENQKYNVATKQTRQGRTFEVKAPSWYAEYGLDYERRRLAAAAVPRREKAQMTPDIGGQGSSARWAAPQRRPIGLLARLFGRTNGADETLRPSGPEGAAVAAPRRGGYYENFVNYWKGAGTVKRSQAAELTNDRKPPAREKQTADQMIDAHFSATHREPDRAAASFRAMFRESPRLALWAAAKYPQAFGEPSGREGPGIAWQAVRALAPTAKPEPAHRMGTRGRRDREAAFAGERLSLREATERARAKAELEKAQFVITRSLRRLAGRIERETATDPHGKDQAAYIRDVARTLESGNGATRTQARDQTERIRGAVSEKDNATLYRELEEQLRQRDRARPKRHPRNRDEGGRDP